MIPLWNLDEMAVADTPGQVLSLPCGTTCSLSPRKHVGVPTQPQILQEAKMMCCVGGGKLLAKYIQFYSCLEKLLDNLLCNGTPFASKKYIANK